MNFYQIDLNTITYKTSGYCSNCTNRPEGMGNGFLEVIPINYKQSDTVLQRYTVYANYIVYVRILSESTGTWSTWEIQNGTAINDVLNNRFTIYGLNGDVGSTIAGFLSNLSNKTNTVHFFSFYNTTDNPFSFICGYCIAMQSTLLNMDNVYVLLGIDDSLTKIEIKKSLFKRDDGGLNLVK